MATAVVSPIAPDATTADVPDGGRNNRHREEGGDNLGSLNDKTACGGAFVSSATAAPSHARQNAPRNANKKSQAADSAECARLVGHILAVLEPYGYDHDDVTAFVRRYGGDEERVALAVDNLLEERQGHEMEGWKQVPLRRRLSSKQLMGFSLGGFSSSMELHAASHQGSGRLGGRGAGRFGRRYGQRQGGFGAGGAGGGGAGAGGVGAVSNGRRAPRQQSAYKVSHPPQQQQQQQSPQQQGSTSPSPRNPQHQQDNQQQQQQQYAESQQRQPSSQRSPQQYQRPQSQQQQQPHPQYQQHQLNAQQYQQLRQQQRHHPQSHGVSSQRSARRQSEQSHARGSAADSQGAEALESNSERLGDTTLQQDDGEVNSKGGVVEVGTNINRNAAQQNGVYTDQRKNHEGGPADSGSPGLGTKAVKNERSAPPSRISINRQQLTSDHYEIKGKQQQQQQQQQQHLERPPKTLEGGRLSQGKEGGVDVDGRVEAVSDGQTQDNNNRRQSVTVRRQGPTANRMPFKGVAGNGDFPAQRPRYRRGKREQETGEMGVEGAPTVRNGVNEGDSAKQTTDVSSGGGAQGASHAVAQGQDQAAGFKQTGTSHSSQLPDPHRGGVSRPGRRSPYPAQNWGMNNGSAQQSQGFDNRHQQHHAGGPQHYQQSKQPRLRAGHNGGDESGLPPSTGGVQGQSRLGGGPSRDGHQGGAGGRSYKDPAVEGEEVKGSSDTGEAAASQHREGPDGDSRRGGKSWTGRRRAEHGRVRQQGAANSGERRTQNDDGSNAPMAQQQHSQVRQKYNSDAHPQQPTQPSTTVAATMPAAAAAAKPIVDPMPASPITSAAVKRSRRPSFQSIAQQQSPIIGGAAAATTSNGRASTGRGQDVKASEVTQHQGSVSAGDIKGGATSPQITETSSTVAPLADLSSELGGVSGVPTPTLPRPVSQQRPTHHPSRLDNMSRGGIVSVPAQGSPAALNYVPGGNTIPPRQRMPSPSRDVVLPGQYALAAAKLQSDGGLQIAPGKPGVIFGTVPLADGDFDATSPYTSASFGKPDVKPDNNIRFYGGLNGRTASQGAAANREAATDSRWPNSSTHLPETRKGIEGSPPGLLPSQTASPEAQTNFRSLPQPVGSAAPLLGSHTDRRDYAARQNMEGVPGYQSGSYASSPLHESVRSAHTSHGAVPPPMGPYGEAYGATGGVSAAGGASYGESTATAGISQVQQQQQQQQHQSQHHHRSHGGMMVDRYSPSASNTQMEGGSDISRAGDHQQHQNQQQPNTVEYNRHQSLHHQQSQRHYQQHQQHQVKRQQQQQHPSAYHAGSQQSKHQTEQHQVQQQQQQQRPVGQSGQAPRSRAKDAADLDIKANVASANAGRNAKATDKLQQSGIDGGVDSQNSTPSALQTQRAPGFSSFSPPLSQAAYKAPSPDGKSNGNAVCDLEAQKQYEVNATNGNAMEETERHSGDRYDTASHRNEQQSFSAQLQRPPHQSQSRYYRNQFDRVGTANGAAEPSEYRDRDSSAQVGGAPAGSQYHQHQQGTEYYLLDSPAEGSFEGGQYNNSGFHKGRRRSWNYRPHQQGGNRSGGVTARGPTHNVTGNANAYNNHAGGQGAESGRGNNTYKAPANANGNSKPINRPKQELEASNGGNSAAFRQQYQQQHHHQQQQQQQQQQQYDAKSERRMNRLNQQQQQQLHQQQLQHQQQYFDHYDRTLTAAGADDANPRGLSAGQTQRRDNVNESLASANTAKMEGKNFHTADISGSSADVVPAISAPLRQMPHRQQHQQGEYQGTSARLMDPSIAAVGTASLMGASTQQAASSTTEHSGTRPSASPAAAYGSSGNNLESPASRQPTHQQSEAGVATAAVGTIGGSIAEGSVWRSATGTAQYYNDRHHQHQQHVHSSGAALNPEYIAYDPAVQAAQIRGQHQLYRGDSEGQQHHQHYGCHAVVGQQQQQHHHVQHLQGAAATLDNFATPHQMHYGSSVEAAYGAGSADMGNLAVDAVLHQQQQQQQYYQQTATAQQHHLQQQQSRHGQQTGANALPQQQHHMQHPQEHSQMISQQQQELAHMIDSQQLQDGQGTTTPATYSADPNNAAGGALGLGSNSQVSMLHHYHQQQAQYSQQYPQRSAATFSTYG